MEFKINNVNPVFTSEEAIKYYKEIGFKFYHNKRDNTYMIISSIIPKIEIKNLKELLEFIDKFGNIILDKNKTTILIYDDYVE